MSDAGDWYRKKQEEQWEAYEVVRWVEKLAAKGEYEKALAVIQERVPPTYYKRIRTYFNIEDTVKAGIQKLKVMAHDSGYTGD
jgi:hypothetical protein